MTVLGLLGAGGAVGGHAARLLAGGASPPDGGPRLRLGGRDPERLAGLPGHERVTVDVTDHRSLRRFTEDCDLVVDCAGPAERTAAPVLRAAAEAGAHYVGAAGEEEAVVSGAADSGAPPDDGRCVLLGAGMTPGLTGLLPRALAAGFDRPRSLTVHAGGRDRFTPAAARDYVAGMEGGAGRSLAGWSAGRRVPGLLTPLARAEPPFFPGAVTAHPFLSAEAERLAAGLGLEELRWYHVFDGEHALRALSARPDEGREARAARLERAAALDLFGRTPYQLMVFRMAGELDGRPRERTLVLRATDSYALTALFTVLAARRVLAGEVAPGVGHAGEVLPAGSVLAGLAGQEAVRLLEIHEHDRPGPAPAVAAASGEPGVEQPEVEEGVL